MNFIRTTTSRLALTLAVLFLGAFSANAATPSTCTTALHHPVGLAASPTRMLATSSDSPINIYEITCGAPGTAVLFSTLPAPAVSITDQEVYLTVAPGSGGFTANTFYASRGNKVFSIPSGGGPATLFATFPVADVKHSGITFDHFGTFAFDMIVTVEGAAGLGGSVFRVSSAPAVALVATLPFVPSPSTANISEGPEVMPSGFFGLPGGQVLFTQEDNDLGTLKNVNSAGTVGTYNTTINDPESVHLIPSPACQFLSSGGAFFTTDYFNSVIIKYPASNFTGLDGNLLLTIEFTTINNNIKMISKAAGNAITDFDTVSNNIVHEGSTFVDCIATMPIIKHSTDATKPPTDADFIFGLYPRGDNGFPAPPAAPLGYVANAAGDGNACPAGTPPPFVAPTVRGTCILTPPENTLPIDLSIGPFNAAVCELKHTTGWTFSSWTVTFTPLLAGDVASAPFLPTGETVDPQIRCINITIVPGTTLVELNVTDTPPVVGGQYCSPGYWKQPQHFGSYPASVNPLTTLFTSKFITGSVHTYDGLTFPQVISLGGGGWNMFGRITAASYLDASTLNFGMPPGQVVTLANAAFASGSTGSAAFNTALNAFNALAIENCPLGNAPLPGGPGPGNSDH